MSRPQVVLRAFFYLWFSLFAGLVAQGLVNVILVYSHAGRPASLPWGGAVGAGIAAAIILGCTEMPVAVEYAAHPIRELCVDPTRALAKACVKWWSNAAEVA